MLTNLSAEIITIKNKIMYMEGLHEYHIKALLCSYKVNNKPNIDMPAVRAADYHCL